MFRPEFIAKKYFISDAVELRSSPVHGTGVWAKRAIPRWTPIEFSPIVSYHKDTHKLLRNNAMGSAAFDYGQIDPRTTHILEQYSWDWDPEEALCCMGWGYVSLYNHSFTPNCMCMNQKADETTGALEGIVIMTCRNVEPGEELFHRYTRWEDGLPFEPVESRPRYGGVLNPSSQKEFRTMAKEASNPMSDTIKNMSAAIAVRNEDKLKSIKDDMRSRGPSLGSFMQKDCSGASESDES